MQKKRKQIIKKEINDFNKDVRQLNINKIKSQKSFDDFAAECRKKIKSRQNKSD